MHAVRIEQLGVVANLHASNGVPDVVVRELVRARAFVDTRAAPDEARILAGDFNLAYPGRSQATRTAGRGSITSWSPTRKRRSPVSWPVERRVANGCVLSDHAPVERLVGPGSAVDVRLRSAARARPPSCRSVSKAGDPTHPVGEAVLPRERARRCPQLPSGRGSPPPHNPARRGAGHHRAHRRRALGLDRALDRGGLGATNRLQRPASPTSSSICSSRAPSATTR